MYTLFEILIMFYTDISIYLCVEGLLTRPTKLLGVVVSSKPHSFEFLLFEWWA